MKYEGLKDFALEKKASEETIEKYKDKLPNEMIEFWKEYGFGSFVKGFYRSIDPDDYLPILRGTYIYNSKAIPIFTTGMGDIIVWANSKYDMYNELYKQLLGPDSPFDKERNHLVLVNYRRSWSISIPLPFEFFFRDIQKSFVIIHSMDCIPYFNLIEEHGLPKYNECFYYAPPLPLGGSEEISKVYIGDMKVQIDIISQLVGPINEAGLFGEYSDALDIKYKDVELGL